MLAHINTLRGSHATLILRDSHSTRFNVTLVGLYENKYLLTSFSGQKESLRHVKVNRQYLVQVHKENVVHVFNASIEKIESGSFPMVHLSLNEEIVHRKRETPRVAGDGSKIKLSLIRGENSIDVTMADISTAGARLVANQRLGNIGDIFAIEVKSLRSEECFHIRCKVRHLRTEIDQQSQSRIVFHYGVEFMSIDEDAKIFLAQFVKETIH